MTRSRCSRFVIRFFPFVFGRVFSFHVKKEKEAKEENDTSTDQKEKKKRKAQQIDEVAVNGVG